MRCYFRNGMNLWCREPKEGICLIVLILTSSMWLLSAQVKIEPDVLRSKSEWSPGSITFREGNQIYGLVKYNENIGVVSFKNEDDSSSYFAKGQISGFTFFDKATDRDRSFYSLTIPAPKSHVEIPAFFEVLYQAEKFAVLSRIDPVELKMKQYSFAPMSGPGSNSTVTLSLNYEVVSQEELIYFADNDGNLFPYLKIKRNSNGFSKETKEKGNIVDGDLIVKYMEVHYGSILNYVHKNKLSFDSKSDLMLILEYYHQLASQ